MSLQARTSYVVPGDTARIARAIFPEASPVMRMLDELHMIVEDRDFADLFPTRGQPAEAPVRLALATLLQFMEGLTDRQAAHAVRTRIDWKYVLCLELADAGFDHTVLSEFRSRLLEHKAERRLFDAVLGLAKARGVLKAGGRQRSDSTHVLGAMRAMTRMEGAAETLRHALDVLATTAPEWLLAHTTPAWVDRYGLRSSEFRLPKGAVARQAWAAQTGSDGMSLLEALSVGDATTAVLRRLPAIEVLRQVWVQNFLVDNASDGPRVAWRANDNIPPAKHYIGSPYDPEARYNNKGSTTWSGYKLYLTETCDEATPNLITDVQTSAATVSDDAVTGEIHGALAERGLLPSLHIADTGFVNADLLVDARQRHGVELVGPTRGDNQWQVKQGMGFAARDFKVDFERQQATCPAGQASESWTPAFTYSGKPVIKVKFASADCRGCAVRVHCTRSSPPRRAITLRPQAEYEALRVGRAREKTADFATEYARRAGVEGTIAQAVRSHAARRTHYIGQLKTHLAHLMIATAMNVVRLLRWLADEPKARTRRSAFAQLYRALT